MEVKWKLAEEVVNNILSTCVPIHKYSLEHDEFKQGSSCGENILGFGVLF